MRCKTIIITYIFLIAYTNLSAQSGQWTWIKGSSTINKNGIYGSLGVADTNTNPGSRRGGVTWIDNEGNFWLWGGDSFGASGNNGYINDLWKYSPLTNKWQWVNGDSSKNKKAVYGSKGVASPANKPGARIGSATWSDNAGNLWLFGGFTYQFINLNDLWKYSIANNQWTWVKGDTTEQSGVYGIKGTPSNNTAPCSRSFAATWTDQSGNFFLFGGTNTIGQVNGYNDVWKYNIANNQWTWLSGDSTPNVLSINGTQNVPSINNKPGTRYGSVAWADNFGNAYVWGGLGYSSTTLNYLADLWKYNATNNTWTWIKGNAEGNDYGIYGTQGIPSQFNKPGARCFATGWTDNEGKLWLLGGRGNSQSDFGDMNDMWSFNTTDNNWTWVKGGTGTYAQGVYGTQGIPSLLNTPGAREQSYGWKDKNGSMWVFGGGGYAALGGNEFFLNDLWKYTPQYAIPVHLVSFKGSLTDNKIRLSWVTENEEKFSHYEIQRSTNGVDFYKIGIQKSNAGRSKNEYSYIDKTLNEELVIDNGQNRKNAKLYYRLKMIDKDATFSYSTIVCISYSFYSKQINISPNPATNYITIQLSEKNPYSTTITMYNAKGIEVLNKQINILNGSVSCFIGNLPSGMYTLKCQIGKTICIHQIVVVN